MSDTHQSLATIPNRYAFLDLLEQEVQCNRHLSLILIDIVRFSEVSSSMGYQVGDRILLDIANRIGKLFTTDGSLMGRVSGDIFALILPGHHSEHQLKQFYSHLINHFKGPVSVADQAFIADFNVGMVSNGEENRDTMRLFSLAESALRQAKQSKYENLRILHLHRPLESGRSLALKADLRRAINKDELNIYFQPKVDLQNLKVVGAECLLRWHHPLDGILLPGALIEAAESYNMMNEVGYWTLERAFKDVLKLKARGIHLPLSVNMSPTQLYDSDFISRLYTLSQMYHVELSEFELELTENIALSNSLLVKRQLSQARAMGMSIAVDDFGKGYSNLAYIRDINVDTIKIDKTFVTELEKNSVNKSIIQATMLIGDAMGSKVQAEGIETMQQLHILRELGIKQGQGFLFSKAVPLDEFVTLAQSDLAVGDSLAYRNRLA